MSETLTLLEVVVGLIERDGRMLLVQRPPPKDFAWCWECPGGKVEPGETHEQALLRELAEEIGLEGGRVRNPGVRPWIAFAPPLVTRACRLTARAHRTA